ncbi:MAG TPA: UDP-galactopyranose mutase [Thermoleophilaceae bacterium]|jgi:UDP-galactopyranose mutase|nr:UDP-galactopyranose mutase [Thermoleophilaceae bacterium]
MPERADSYDTLVIGAGFAGAVTAERLASQLGQRVLVIDRRAHIGGNAFDERDEHDVLVHRYGPHIFHTNSGKVVDYLSQFTEWLPYEHRVLAQVGDQRLPIPINRTTINQLYGLDLRTDDEARAFYAQRAEPVGEVRNSEQVVVAKAGRELYETFFRGYTKKQWGREPSELAPSVCGRIPLRTSCDDRYFSDSFQQMPAEGYTAMFERMLAHPDIEVCTGTEFEDVRDQVDYGHLVYTGPIDSFFGYRFGKLPYRSLEFRTETHQTLDGGFRLPCATVNYPSLDVAWTRITEYRHMTGQLRHHATTLHVEFPQAEGDPYYPIPSPETRELYKRYEALANTLEDVTFVGRLARYQYLNMDQVVAQALQAFERIALSVEAQVA